jgi:hypothetical protein
MALYAVMPMLLAVQAGRLVDRVGRLPADRHRRQRRRAGMLLPFVSPALPMLFVSARGAAPRS